MLKIHVIQFGENLIGLLITEDRANKVLKCLL